MESQSSLLVADQSRQEGKWACWAGKAQKLLPASPDWSHTPRASWRSWRSSLSHGSWKRDSPSQTLPGKAVSQLLGTRSSTAQRPPSVFSWGCAQSWSYSWELSYLQSKREVSSEWELVSYHSQTFSPASIGSWGPLKICWVPLDFFPRKKNQPNI